MTEPSAPGTRSIIRRLLVWMLTFGACVGIVFPFFALLALDSPDALSWWFFAMCIGAGLFVGGTNFLLFDVVVTKEIQRVVTGMRKVNINVSDAERGSGDCTDECRLDVTSSDAIGQIAETFNEMSASIADRIYREVGVRSLLSQVTATSDVSTVAAAILRSLAGICRGAGGLLYGNTGTEFNLLAVEGLDKGDGIQRQLDIRLGPVATALAEGSPVRIVPRDDGFEWVTASTPLGSLRPTAMVVIPLMIKEHPAGIAVLALADDCADERTRMLVEVLREQAAPHLQNALLNQKHKRAAQMAAEDELTGLLNRRFGGRRLREEFARSSRHQVPLGVLMIDVDRFKAVNDTWGHDAGDAVLRAVANVASESLRASDVICRWGGEEFLVLAPATDLDNTLHLADRLRRLVESVRVPFGDQVLNVTISVGVATFPNLNVTQSESLVTAADRALYHAKEIGRNRVAVDLGERVISMSEYMRTPEI